MLNNDDGGTYSHRIELVDIDESSYRPQNAPSLPSSSSSITMSMAQNQPLPSTRHATQQRQMSSSNSNMHDDVGGKGKKRSPAKHRGIYDNDGILLGSTSSNTRIGSSNWHPRRVASDDTIHDWWATMTQRTRHTTSGQHEVHYSDPPLASSSIGSTRINNINNSSSSSDHKRAPSVSTTSIDDMTMSERTSYQNRLAAAEARWAGVGAVYGEVLSLRRQRDDVDAKFSELEQHIRIKDVCTLSYTL
jgi:hypothetical protein